MPRVRRSAEGEGTYVGRGSGSSGGVVVFAGEVELTAQPALRYDYTVRVRIQRGHPRAAVSEMTIRSRDGAGVTARGAEIARAGRMAIAALSFPVDETGHFDVLDRVITGRGPSREQLNAAVALAGAKGTRERVASQVQVAARVYRDAQRAGRPTTVAVAVALRETHSVARKRVATARRLGLLPPAESTRPAARQTARQSSRDDGNRQRPSAAKAAGQRRRRQT